MWSRAVKDENRKGCVCSLCGVIFLNKAGVRKCPRHRDSPSGVLYQGTKEGWVERWKICIRCGTPYNCGRSRPEKRAFCSDKCYHFSRKTAYTRRQREIVNKKLGVGVRRLPGEVVELVLAHSGLLHEIRGRRTKT